MSKFCIGEKVTVGNGSTIYTVIDAEFREFSGYDNHVLLDDGLEHGHSLIAHNDSCELINLLTKEVA